jgi:hypothetical protein
MHQNNITTPEYLVIRHTIVRGTLLMDCLVPVLIQADAIGHSVFFLTIRRHEQALNIFQPSSLAPPGVLSCKK